jgi:hypothetical protein
MATSLIFRNGFGEVMPDRIVFNVKKSLFSGSIREDFPVRHITSVRYETKRSPISGIILGLVGLVLLKASFIIAIIVLAISALLLFGTPSVSINSAGGERRVSVGSPFSGADAQRYVEAVREALFAKE